MTSDTPPLIVGMGRIGVAISSLAPNAPVVDGGTTELAAMATIPSPGVAVALRAALQLGCRARLVGTHGADLLGGLARSALRDAGIEAEMMRAGGTSSCDVVIVAPDGRVRVHYAGDQGEPLKQDPTLALGGARAALIDGTLPDAQLGFAEAARRAKLPVILHLSLGRGGRSIGGELRHGIGELISASSILIASESAASELAPRGELADALEELAALGPRAVVITLGANGAIGRHGDQVVRCPPFPCEVLDAFGAGSVFHGAFAAALLSELPFHRCIELACAAASLSLRELGPWTAMPNRDEVLALVRARRAA